MPGLSIILGLCLRLKLKSNKLNFEKADSTQRLEITKSFAFLVTKYTHNESFLGVKIKWYMLTAKAFSWR